MTRDTLGHRVKRTVTPFEQSFMEKFYIHNNKVYQIIRVKETRKLSGNLVDILCIEVRKNGKGKLRNVTMMKEELETRKHYHTKRKAFLVLLFQGLTK
jgi:hypothetical protein